MPNAIQSAKIFPDIAIKIPIQRETRQIKKPVAWHTPIAWHAVQLAKGTALLGFGFLGYLGLSQLFSGSSVSSNQPVPDRQESTALVTSDNKGNAVSTKSLSQAEALQAGIETQAGTGSFPIDIMAIKESAKTGLSYHPKTTEGTQANVVRKPIASGIKTLSVPTEGLVAYWPFNGNANDESGHGNHGEVHDAILTDDRFGLTDRAYRFGASDYIKFSSDSLPLGASDRTIAFWVESSNMAVGNTFMVGWGSDQQYHESVLLLGIGDNPSRKFAFWGHSNDLPSNSLLSDNTWHHLTFTLENLIGKLYLNGVLDVTKDLSERGLNTNSGTGLYAGKHTSWLKGFIGRIDDIRIYNRSLSRSEVETLYRLSKSILRIGCNIDGSDWLHIKNNNVWFVHDKYGKPTVITLNGKDYSLEWEDGATSPIHLPIDEFFLPLPQNPTVLLHTIDKRGPISITQQPSDLNDYETVVFIDDKIPSGSYPYVFQLEVFSNNPFRAINIDQSLTYAEDDVRAVFLPIVISTPAPSANFTLSLSDKQAGRLNTTFIGDVFVKPTFSDGIWNAAGNVTEINKLLTGLQFIPAPDYDRNFTIDVHVEDGVNPPIASKIRVIGIPVNDPPFLIKKIGDRNVIVGEKFTLDLKDYFDDIDDKELRLSAKLGNDQPLPVWLGLDKSTGILSGTASDQVNLQITVTASDLHGKNVSDSFILLVKTEPSSNNDNNDNESAWKWILSSIGGGVLFGGGISFFIYKKMSHWRTRYQRLTTEDGPYAGQELQVLPDFPGNSPTPPNAPEKKDSDSDNEKE